MTEFRRWLPIFIAAVWLAIMGQICLSKFSLSNDVSKFLVDSNNGRLTWISRRLTESELTKTAILVVGTQSGNKDRALAAAGALADMLEADKEVAWVRRGWDPTWNQAIHELYFPHRFHFAADDPATLPEQLSDAGLKRAASEVAEQLRASHVSREQIARDPLLLYPAQVNRISEALRVAPVDAEGRYVTADGRAVVVLTTRHSPFDFDTQRPLQDAITERFAELDRNAQAAGDDLTLIQSGVARFALEAESDIRGDIGRISKISMLGVVALLLILFRSPWMLMLSLLPLLVGFLTAMGLCLVFFGNLHILTLAFGASLIGVCIDYPIHLFTHHAFYPVSDRQEMVAGVRPGLLLGSLTTIAGFLGMGWAAFPGAGEIAAFAGFGILAALITTLWVLPSLLPEKTEPGPAQRWMMARAEQLVAWMSRSRFVLIALPLAALAIMAIGLPQIEYQDDVSVLADREPQLMAEEREVRSLVSRMDGGRMIVAFGEDHEDALLRNDEVHRRLEEAVAAGELTEFRSLHTFLRPTSVQVANRKQFCSREGLPSALARAYVGQDLPDNYAPFIEDLTELCRTNPKPVELSALDDSTLGSAVAPLWLEYGRQTALITYVAGVKDAESLHKRMAGVEGVVVFDRRVLMTQLFGRHRSDTTELLGLGLLAVMLILFARHGELRSTLAAVVPSILAAGMTLGLLALFGSPITLMHVVGLVLVLSMGVDYGVFLTESRGDMREVAATIFSLLACCLTTVLSIGLLGLSSSPGLHALGVTTGIGVLFSLLLAPTALVLLGVMDSSVRRQ